MDDWERTNEEERLLVAELYESPGKRWPGIQFSVLTPYKVQKEALQARTPIPDKEIHTWDSTQGLQRRGVIVVCTRSGNGWNPGQYGPRPLPLEKKIGFLWDVRRLCVATSRAGEVMIIIAIVWVDDIAIGYSSVSMFETFKTELQKDINCKSII